MRFLRGEIQPADLESLSRVAHQSTGVRAKAYKHCLKAYIFLH
jgi:hypothetical protein